MSEFACALICNIEAVLTNFSRAQDAARFQSQVGPATPLEWMVGQALL